MHACSRVTPSAAAFTGLGGATRLQGHSGSSRKDRRNQLTEVGSSDGSDAAWLFSLDLSRYESTSVGYLLWLRSDRKPDGYVDRLGNYDHFVQHLEIDCKGHRQRVMRNIMYAGSRNLNPKEATQAGPNKWVELVPGTMGDDVLTSTCKGLAELETQ